MPRALPSNPALIVDDPTPLERYAGFPHEIVPFPVDDLLAYGGLMPLLPPSDVPADARFPHPAEPESAL